ncbi:MAG: outer membrane protein [Candidatus Parcubacteria bacterium]|nr:MAG: outer membrane protein [Candidatus Parcubacteria bacterium]
MDQNLKNSIIISLFLFVIAIFWFVYEYKNINQPQRTFSVTGEGKEVAVPNIAEIRIGVITDGKDLKNLQQENSNKMNKIINFLKEQGIVDKDIKTENYSITPKYDYRTSSYQIVGYTISQNLVVKIRDLTKIGEILDGVVKRGANNVSGPNFTIDESESYLAKAREKAILNAKEKAEIIAKIAGFKLGKIVSISEYSSFPSIPLYSKYVGTSGDEGETIPQIEPGSQEIKVQINITFEIR